MGFKTNEVQAALKLVMVSSKSILAILSMQESFQ